MSRKKSATTAPAKPTDRDILFDQLKQIAQGLGETFAPFCEVVLHDLTDPKKAIKAIHNNLSGREYPTACDSNSGLARYRRPRLRAGCFASNYDNAFSDGREA